MDRIEDFFKKNKKEFDFVQNESNDWESISNRLDQKPAISRKGPSYWAIAASIALVISLTLFYFWQPKPVNEMQALTGLHIGNQFPELELRNPEGEMVPLSELKAQVVLVDFWASYCMVCNEENCYYFKPLYNEYKDQGFEIYAVSADSSAVSWVNAIQRDQLDWVQVSDLKGFDSPIFDNYEVNALPTNYLLDKEGRIIAKNINVYELEDTLVQILAYQ